MTNFIESIKEGFSIIKEELEELDRRTDFNRLFLDKMLNKMNLLDDNADILEYLDVDDSDDYYDDEREEHFGIVSLALMFVALAAIRLRQSLVSQTLFEFFCSGCAAAFSFLIFFVFRFLFVFFSGILYLYLIIKKGDCE